MKEARIECITHEWAITDLNLEMKKGEVKFFNARAAKQSKDLAHARRISAVRVEFVERSRMAKKPTVPPRIPGPPNVRLSRKGRKQPPAQKPVPPATFDMDEIRRIAREEARAGAREGTAEGVEAGVRAALSSLPVAGPAVDQSMLEAALRNVLPGITVAAPTAPASSGVTSSTRSKGPEEPVFIPSSIIDKDSTTELKTQSSESEDDGVAEAAAALKAAKGTGGRKRSTRKKKTSAAKAEE
jgi:hypothetical protein